MPPEDEDPPVVKAALENFERMELHAAIGEFIYTFSHLEFTIRHLLGLLLGLNDDQFYVVTSPYDFATLCRVTSTLLSQLSEAELSDKSAVEKTFKRCLAMNDERVRIAHGTWLFKQGAQHVSRSTFQTKMYFATPEEIKKLTSELRLVDREVAALVVVITANQLPD